MCIRDSNYLVKDVNKLAQIVKEAFYIAGSGRPGPVSYTHLDVYKRQVIKDAREIGYKHMRLDTFPFMSSAIELYKKYRFYVIDQYLSLIHI